ncbi:PepSY domain-containing protein [Roseibacterium sp. SDUM158016]|uniref:PepSY domain-containing protein n=1 Tax=Roseicyclus sediminis TaxID=2980997 RepID=UPI0021D22DE1|nr:PepSY domain-containing protein [Roseibacterium sp. SDUM158016]MCU4654839.1 PepSY domain-containing protein [Roseibacterium sp. SDUM158016]
MRQTRRKFLLTAGAAVLAATPAFAQDDRATRSVIRQLEAQGFTIVSARRTLLGRVRVIARRGDLMREIVLDPRNGSILRDYSEDSSGDPSIGPSPGDDDDGDDDDDDSDDDDDDDDDDDNSGSSGNSGSGGGGGDDDDDDDD